ncbi:MAG: adenylosuccinate lyase [Candidatus Omnitrophica bacterium]|nr:adenylosuccinate lyase [Candidatus Omnitrophota bacterium]
MIIRYTRPQMGQIWTEENKFKTWLEVELAVVEAQAKLGIIPKDIPSKLRSKTKNFKFDVARIQEIERTVKHDVIAFLTYANEEMGPEGRWIHFGMTSSDVLDTGLALQIKEASQLLMGDVKRLIRALGKKARAHKFTLMVGRSHGVHAEPITFGLKMALFYAEFQRNLERLEEAARQIAFGKISGAVGTFANIPPEVEEAALQGLGLEPAPISTQIIQRDRHAYFMAALAVTAGSLEKLATEIRLLQKTETLEVEELFAKGQKGSSAMPHKRNPVSCERVAGLARLIRGYAQAALENQALWHERDITHSSVERVIFPDATIALDFMLSEMTTIIENLVVNKDNMKKNLELMRGMVFSQGLLLELVKKGLTREEGYKMVQESAAKVWDKSADLKSVVLKSASMTQYLSKKEIENIFDYDYHTKNVDAIFKRLRLSSERSEE